MSGHATSCTLLPSPIMLTGGASALTVRPLRPPVCTLAELACGEAPPQVTILAPVSLLEDAPGVKLSGSGTSRVTSAVAT